MTDEQIQKAEQDAESDAEWLLLMLLLIAARKRKTRKSAVFQADVGRFYFNGKSVSITTIRNYLNRIERRVGNRVMALVDDLDAGRITVDQWQKEFERNVTSSHILAGALALGGIATAARNTEVQERIAAEKQFAENFSKQVKSGKAGTSKQVRARAKSYVRAATITYSQLEQKARGLLGIQTECRRIRRASESCPGCINYSYRWMPIEKMPPLGSLDCGGNCRCYLEYR